MDVSCKVGKAVIVVDVYCDCPSVDDCSLYHVLFIVASSYSRHAVSCQISHIKAPIIVIVMGIN